MKKVALLILFAVAGCYGKLIAQELNTAVSGKTGWYKILEKTVDVKRNREEIPVVNSDRFAAVKVIVKNADINLYGIEVYYKGGNGQIIGVSKAIKAGNQTESFDLESSQKDLRKVALAYKTIPNNNNKKAQIEVWGFRTTVYGQK